MAKTIVDIKFSRTTKKLANFEATMPQILAALMIANGFGANEAAWAIYYGFDKTLRNDTAVQKGQQLLDNDKVRKLIEYFSLRLSTQKTNTVQEAVQENVSMDAEETALELLRIANTLPDGKEKADLMMKYADLKGFKKAAGDIKSETRDVAFVIPVQCHTCPCYKYAMDNAEVGLKPLNSSKV